jgi:hypothetical protein
MDHAQQAFSMKKPSPRILLGTHGKSVPVGNGDDSQSLRSNAGGKLFINENVKH